MAKHALGCTVSLGGTALAEVTALGVPAITAEVIDVTSHDSADGFRDHIRGLFDTEEFTITMYYVAGSTTDDACIAAVTGTAAVAVEILAYAEGGTEDITFNAFATNYNVNDLVPGEAQTATLTLKPTGAKPTQAATA